MLGKYAFRPMNPMGMYDGQIYPQHSNIDKWVGIG